MAVEPSSRPRGGRPPCPPRKKRKIPDRNPTENLQKNSDENLQKEARELLQSSDNSSMETFVNNVIIPPQDKQQETLLKYCRQNYPSALSLKLLHISHFSFKFHTRIFAASLLQDLPPHHHFSSWPSISNMILSELKSDAFPLLAKEDSKPVFRILCKIISEIAFRHFKTRNDGRRELLDFIVSRLGSETPEEQGLGLLMFHELFKNLVGFINPYLGTIYLSILRCLNSMNAEIRTLAFGASVTFMHQLKKPDDHFWISNLLISMRKSLSGPINEDFRDMIQMSLKKLVDLVKDEQEIYETQVNSLFELVLGVTEMDSIGEGAPTVALDIFLLLTEEWRHEINEMLNSLTTDKFNRFLVTLIEMISNISDDHNGNDLEAEKGEEFFDEESYRVGTACLEQVTFAVSKHESVPVALELIAQFVASPDWKRRHAGITSIQLLSEAITDHLDVEQARTVVLRSLRDLHPQVCLASINATEALLNLRRKFHVQNHHRILPALSAVTKDSQNPHLQVRAAQAIRTFCLKSTPDDLSPYLGDTVKNLLALLKNEDKKLHETTLEALASVASSSQAYFQKHYKTVMRRLLLFNLTGVRTGVLLAKNADCIGCIAVAIGKEKFKIFAKESITFSTYFIPRNYLVVSTFKSLRGKVIRVVISVQKSMKQTHYVTRFYIFKAWVHLCKCLQRDVASHIQDLMPVVLNSAHLNPQELSVSPRVHMDRLREKTMACILLSTCAFHLKEMFSPWARVAGNVLVPLLTFRQEPEIRKASASAMPELLSSFKSQGKIASYTQKFVIVIIPALVEALGNERDRDNSAVMLTSLNKCIEITGSLFTIAQFKLILEAMEQALITYLQRNLQIRDVNGEAKHTEEDNIVQIGTCLSTLIDRFTDKIRPFLDQNLSQMMLLWAPLATEKGKNGQRKKLALCTSDRFYTGDDRTAKERAIAFGIFTSVIQKYEDLAHKYYDLYLPQLFKACYNENIVLQQEAVRGIGVCVDFSPSKFRASAEAAIWGLYDIVRRNWEYSMVYYDAITVLGSYSLSSSFDQDILSCCSCYLSCSKVGSAET
ncbi:importin-5-like [Tripterygium wilfordii]|uniref:importin-5-like n=1 Tax=Tripterygium wilfordii TaxID=458696 RepID=UPI0018F82E4C|nr:importin-5-like [Tripterygium wilfordii]